MLARQDDISQRISCSLAIQPGQHTPHRPPHLHAPASGQHEQRVPILGFADSSHGTGDTAKPSPRPNLRSRWKASLRLMARTWAAISGRTTGARTVRTGA